MLVIMFKVCGDISWTNLSCCLAQAGKKQRLVAPPHFASDSTSLCQPERIGEKQANNVREAIILSTSAVKQCFLWQWVIA